MGYSCNLRCRFCYYFKDLKLRNRNRDLTTEECKRRIRHYHRCNMKVLEFTGGEPTIRGDLFELARYARESGFSKISIITNGIRLADFNYARELVNSGIGDFLLSLHGSSAQIHDFVTGTEGSYESLLKAVQNLSRLSVRIRFNSVVTGLNLYDVYARAKLFKELNIQIVNFIMFNPIEQAKFCEEGNFLRYSGAAAQLKKVIDDFGNSFDKLTIRYMPLCAMGGYENYIQNVHQVHYDHDEWDYYLRSYIREPRWKWLAGILIGLILLPRKRQWLAWGIGHARHAAILQAHSWLNKSKPIQCRRCRYGFICGGVWKEYARRFGTSELKAVSGEFVLRPWHFLSDRRNQP